MARHGAQTIIFRKSVVRALTGRVLFPMLLLSVSVVWAVPQKPARSEKASGKTAAVSGKPAKPEKTAYDFVLPSADGKNIPLSSFRGKYLLIVNLARESSYTSQLPGLIKLSETYRDRGLVVIGVPSNDFGTSEPGTDAEIQKFYGTAKSGFLITAVSKLTGEDALPLYFYLTHPEAAQPVDAVHWNYTKFFVGPDGKMIVRVDPDVAPDSPEMIATIEQILGNRYKPAGKPEKDTLNVAASGDK